MGSISWDAERYDRQPLPHEQWGAGVIDRAHLCAGDSLVDAGCGTGRDALLALNRLQSLALAQDVHPGRVTLLDADAGMIRSARSRFSHWSAPLAPAITQADLTQPWPVDEPADVIISVAALHWISDHEAVFGHGAAISTPQARLHVDCGGAGNIAGILQAAGRVGLPVPTWNFATVDATIRALRASGWVPREVWLQPDPLVLPDDTAFDEFLSTVMFHQASAGQIATLIGMCEEPVVDYVRLNIDAVRK